MLRTILDTVKRTEPLHISDVGQILKQYRSIHQLTQSELATLLECNQSYISKLENGQSLRDIAALKRIADRLGIPGQWLGLHGNGSATGQGAELIDIASSVIRLSQTVRESGRADVALHEVWPLVVRLEAQTTRDNDNPRLYLALAYAQATLGIILGDLLSEEHLWISVHFFKQAVAIVNEHGEAQTKAEIYRGCGNELRKHKQHTEAQVYLEQALELATDPISKGLAAALLARTFGELGERERFREVMQAAIYFQNRASAFTPTFNPVMMQEIHIRGLLNIGEVGAIPALLEQDTTRFLTTSVAPQWQVIAHLTKAEAQIQLGKLDDGLGNLKIALVGAELCKLPHQVQRAIRAVHTVGSHSAAQALENDAQLLLGRLSQQTVHLPAP